MRSFEGLMLIVVPAMLGVHVLVGQYSLWNGIAGVMIRRQQISNGYQHWYKKSFAVADVSTCNAVRSSVSRPACSRRAMALIL